MALPALALLGKAASAVGTGVRVAKKAARAKKTIDALMKAKKLAKTAKEKAAIAAKIAAAKSAPVVKQAAKTTAQKAKLGAKIAAEKGAPVAKKAGRVVAANTRKAAAKSAPVVKQAGRVVASSTRKVAKEAATKAGEMTVRGAVGGTKAGAKIVKAYGKGLAREYKRGRRN